MPGPHHSWSGPPQPQPYQPYPAPQQQQGIPQGHPQGEYSDGFMNALGSNMDDLTLSEDSMPDLPPLDDSAPRPTFTTLGRKKTARLPPAPVEGEAAPVTKTTAQAQAQAQLQLNQQPGTSISLLKNIDIYRKSAKSTNDPELQFEFAKFCVESSEQLEEPKARAKLLDEGFTWLKKLSQSGFTEATYYLGLAYTHDGRHDQALSQYLAAAKKFHPSACYATADAMENARGTRKDTKNALQFYKKGATAGHKPSMFRLGVAYLHGELGLKQDVKEAVRWLKRGAAVADREHPEALYQLFLIYERGLPPQIPADVPYARSVLMEAANLGYVPALSKLGACYKDGILEFPVDPRESVRFFSEAAQGGDKEAQFALSGWYLVGVDGVLQQNEEEAFYWAQKAAKKNLARAQYAVGHFLEMGIGTPKNMEEAMKMYMSAAKIGDSQARQRLEKAGVDIDKELKKNQKDCIIS
ncbi:hypothetical protein HK102_009359 [Quaeritorhiza haematococci]|nr:hypothetical protein HK102_009359 [Quaeritorhiza haematococci]